MAGAVGIPIGGAYMMGNYMENGQPYQSCELAAARRYCKTLRCLLFHLHAHGVLLDRCFSAACRAKYHGVSPPRVCQFAITSLAVLQNI